MNYSLNLLSKQSTFVKHKRQIKQSQQNKQNMIMNNNNKSVRFNNTTCGRASNKNHNHNQNQNHNKSRNSNIKPTLLKHNSTKINLSRCKGKFSQLDRYSSINHNFDNKYNSTQQINRLSSQNNQYNYQSQNNNNNKNNKNKRKHLYYQLSEELIDMENNKQNMMQMANVLLDEKNKQLKKFNQLHHCNKMKQTNRIDQLNQFKEINCYQDIQIKNNQELHNNNKNNNQIKYHNISIPIHSDIQSNNKNINLSYKDIQKPINQFLSMNLYHEQIKCKNSRQEHLKENMEFKKNKANINQSKMKFTINQLKKNQKFIINKEKINHQKQKQFNYQQSRQLKIFNQILINQLKFNPFLRNNQSSLNHIELQNHKYLLKQFQKHHHNNKLQTNSTKLTYYNSLSVIKQCILSSCKQLSYIQNLTKQSKTYQAILLPLKQQLFRLYRQYLSPYLNQLLISQQLLKMSLYQDQVNNEIPHDQSNQEIHIKQQERISQAKYQHKNYAPNIQQIINDNNMYHNEQSLINSHDSTNKEYQYQSQEQQHNYNQSEEDNSSSSSILQGYQIKQIELQGIENNQSQYDQSLSQQQRQQHYSRNLFQQSNNNNRSQSQFIYSNISESNIMIQSSNRSSSLFEKDTTQPNIKIKIQGYQQYHLGQSLYSGRNLLDTFNNQHLALQLNQINNQIKNQHGNHQQEDKEEDNWTQQIRKKQLINVQNQSYKDYDQNRQQLQESQKQQHHYQDSNMYNNQQSNYYHLRNNQIKRLSRKLFTQQEQQEKKQQQDHYHTLSENQSQLIPSYYYRITSIIKQQSQQIKYNNYLQLQQGNAIKLLRKTQNDKWIAQFNDSIGFVNYKCLRMIAISATTPRKQC